MDPPFRSVGLAAVLATVWVVLLLAGFAVMNGLSSRDKALRPEMATRARQSLMLAEYTQRLVFNADLIASSLEEELGSSERLTADGFLRRAGSAQMHRRLYERLVHTPDLDRL